ncbi:hypothetical protein SPSYN_02485 [Sporotomaculum syntrophicum]|uniref:Uncharacterized protein n=1 Tax=Sporotomaculum syntrophicum TaxID=182264 RepID=A0A9D2WNK4_9FIRM|nr:hypothetical protein [Sporotomaculum syntrophicum]KAF1084705.1 hypothetical protein SPSYN_02485 [Sporotomaculum syntrophicum]
MIKKNIYWIIIICFSALVSGNAPTATAADSDTDNPNQYIFLFYVEGLNDTELDGSGLPNMKKLKSTGISYQHVTKTIPAEEQEAFLSLTRSLSNNNIDCLAVDGGKKLTTALAKKNGLELISEKNDQLAVDRLLEKIKGQPDQFTAIYLDDASQTEKPGRKWSTADNQVGRVINQLMRSDKLANTTIIITGGGDTPPLVIFNNGQNQPESYYHCRQLDIAPTICKIYGITPPAAITGSVLYECLSQSSSKALTSNLKLRINDLQKETQQYNQQIILLHKERQTVIAQQADLKKAREDIQQIILAKDSTIERLSLQIKILKILGTVILSILLIGYIFLYRWLRKKYLLF